MLPNLSLGGVGHDLLNLAIAYLIALPIGWNRKHCIVTADELKLVFGQTEVLRDLQERLVLTA